MIAIVDYGMGNLFSIYNALNRVDASLKIVNDPEDLSLANADGIVIPGVGAFGRCMDRLSRFEGALLRPFWKERRFLEFASACRCSLNKAKRVPDPKA